jgi:pentatricopeptide repeat protein
MCETMREDGVLPDVVTYSTVINACENARQLDAALQVYEDMRLAGVPPNDYTFRSLIRCMPPASYTPIPRTPGGRRGDVGRGGGAAGWHRGVGTRGSEAGELVYRLEASARTVRPRTPRHATTALTSTRLRHVADVRL